MEIKEKKYEMTIPQDAITIIKFNECQQAIAELQNRVNPILPKGNRDKLKEAYSILEEIQYWIIENAIIPKGNKTYVVGEVRIYVDEDSLGFPSKYSVVD